MDLPKEETSGKKKKQKKPKPSKTQTLNDFLADTNTGSKDPPKRTGSWADAMEERQDAEGEVSTSWQGGGTAAFDRSQLPSAPRKAQARNIDMSQLPKAPPYTVYLGNLSYECDEDDIVCFFQRKNLKVKEVRLPTDSGTSRPKGFGYAELESVSDLLAALELSGENMRNRQVNIDLATSKTGDTDGLRGERYRRDSEDRTATDWRRGSGEDYQNGPDAYRGDRPYGGKGYGDEYRGGRRGRRDYGSGGWNERPEYYRDNRYGNYRHGDYPDSGYGRQRYDDRGPHRYSDDGGYGRGHSPPIRPEPQERPRLQLQPRTKPADSAPADGRSAIFGAARPVDTASREQQIELKLMRERERAAEEEQKAQRQRELREEREKVSIFGGARPVDTARREMEVEEKLRRQEELAERTRRERRDSDRERRGSERERRGSDRERRGSDRERRDSDRERRGSDSTREWPPEKRRGQHSQSPEGEGHREGTRRGDDQEGGGQGHSRPSRDHSVPQSREEDEREHCHERGKRDEEEGGGRGRRRGGWRDGEGRGRRPPGRGRVESSDREPEMGTGESRRGGGGGRGGRGRKDPRVDRQKGSDSGWTQRKPSRGDDGPPGRKYEEPPQPTFSQPSRYAMLEVEEPSKGGEEGVEAD